MRPTTPAGASPPPADLPRLERVSSAREVEIRDESIRLGQFLKLANLVESGAEAKPLIAAGEVRVNGEVETRRGRQLHPGDIVAMGDETVRIT